MKKINLKGYGAMLVLGLTGNLVSGLFSLPKAAADFSGIAPGGSQSLTTETPFTYSINSLATTIIAVIGTIAGVLAVAYLIWSGIQYIVSAGDPEKAKSARAGIINAVIGIVIIVAAYTIIRFAFSAGTIFNNMG